MPTASPRRPAEIAVLFGADGAGDRTAVGRKAWGVWWQWDARLTIALLLELIFIGVPAGAQVRRSRLGQAGRGGRHLRHGDRAVRLQVGGHLAHRFTRTTTVVPTLRAANGRRRSGSASLAFMLLFGRAADAAREPRQAPGGARRAVSRVRGLMMTFDVSDRADSFVLLLRRRLQLQPPPGQSEFVPVDSLPPSDQLPAAPLLIAAYAFVWLAVMVLPVVDLAAAEQGRRRDARARAPERRPRAMTAGHFIFIPSVMLVGVIIGWVLGSRAARDAYAAELRAAREKAAAKGEKK